MVHNAGIYTPQPLLKLVDILTDRTQLEILLRIIHVKTLIILTILIILTTLILINISSTRTTVKQTNNINLIADISQLQKDTNIQTYVENIYKFLLAEIAVYRDDPQIAIDNLKQLLTTDDPQMAHIVTEYAIELEDYNLAIKAAKIWAELEPNNFKAQIIAVTMLLEEQPELVEKYLAQAIKADPQQVDSQISNLLPKLLDHHKQLILNILKNLAQRHPNNPIIHLCLAQIAAQLQDIKTASLATYNALKLKPDLTHAIFLQAKLIKYNTNSDQLALNYLKKQINNFPNKEELKLFYINVLLDNNKFSEAIPYLNNLFNSKDLNYVLEAQLLMAEIYLEKDYLNIEKAKLYLNKLIDLNFAPNKAAFLLGQIAERQHNIPDAVKWYTAIPKEPYHVIGHIRAAVLLANNQQISEAIIILDKAQPNNSLEKKQILLFKIELALNNKDLESALISTNDGLEMLPNDIDFLYAHSIIASLTNQISIAEKDLKQILTLQPNNHSILNALGYLLAAHTNRNKEAFSYLTQALELSPDNPAYMDSMGWLLYRMGKMDDSLELLYRAYNMDGTPSIANHLGEVLWSTGQQQQATAIWKKAWQEDPNDLELLNTLKQYKIKFSN